MKIFSHVDTEKDLPFPWKAQEYVEFQRIVDGSSCRV